MSRAGRIASLGNRTAVLMVLVLVCLVTCHCDDDDNVINASGPYMLSFSLLGDFGPPHGGQPVSWALLRSSDGVVVASGSGTIAPTVNPAFLITTGPVMESGIDYEIHYWIDSNINGGTLGVCDLEDVDRQWSTEFLAVTNDINFLAVFNSETVEYVCDTFN